jgi:hypothetical protein
MQKCPRSHHGYGITGVVAAVLLAGSLAAQTRQPAPQADMMSKEQAFFYLMRVYNLAPTTGTFEYPGDIQQLGSNYFQYYVLVFDSINFAAIRNNEFERPRYAARMDQRLRDGLASVRFDRSYRVSVRAAVGEYSFTNHAFPIVYDPEHNWLTLLHLPRLGSHGDIANLTSFGSAHPNGRVLFLPMSEADARRFVTQRTAPGGSVDRRIALIFTYSVLNKQSTNRGSMGRSAGLGGLGRDLVVFVHSIDIYGYGSEKLGTIFPNQSFEEFTRRTSQLTGLLVGSWQFDTGVETFFADGRTLGRFNSGATVISNWTLDVGTMEITLITVQRNGRSVTEPAHRFHVVELTDENYAVTDAAGKTYRATRIKN